MVTQGLMVAQPLGDRPLLQVRQSHSKFYREFTSY